MFADVLDKKEAFKDHKNICLWKTQKLKKKSMILEKKEAFQDYKNVCLWKTQNKNFFIGVTGGYKGLQGLTGGYNGVTKDFRNFILSRTFPNTLS